MARHCLVPTLRCLRAGAASYSSPPAALPPAWSGGQKASVRVCPLQECTTHSKFKHPEGWNEQAEAPASGSYSLFNQTGNTQSVQRKAMNTGHNLFGENGADSRMARKSQPQEGGVSYQKPLHMPEHHGYSNFPNSQNDGRASE